MSAPWQWLVLSSRLMTLTRSSMSLAWNQVIHSTALEVRQVMTLPHCLLLLKIFAVNWYEWDFFIKGSVINTAFKVAHNYTVIVLPILSEIWYQVFLWALFSSMFVHIIATLIAFCRLRKHKIGRWIPLGIFAVGVISPLTLGVVSSKLLLV